MRNYSEKGIGFIFALIAAAIISLCIVTIVKCLQRGFLGLAFANSAHQAQTKITTGLIQDLELLEQSPIEEFFNVLNNDPDVEVNLLGSGNKTLALISRTLTESNYKNGEGLFLAIKNAPGSGASQLDWNYASEVVTTSPTACANWAKETNFNRSAVNPRSTNTCTHLNNIRDSFFLFGNVSSTRQLAIENVSDKTIYVLLSGYLKLADTLALNNIERSNIFLIAAGEIEIANISLSNVHNSKLLINSAAGPVDISFTDALITLCNSPTAGTLELFVEAFKNVRINSKDYGTNLNFGGCSLIRDSEFWPKFRILGRP